MLTSSMSGPAAPAAQGLPDRFLLAAHHYTDPRWLPIEQQAIFRRTWQYVGDRGELRAPHSVWVKAIADTTILITRSGEDELRAFANLCPHRAAELCPELGLQSRRQLVCPYHAWVYDLEGHLIGTPSRDRFGPDFRPEDYPLTPLRLESWAGFLFVCFDPDAPSLADFLGTIPATLGGHRTAATRRLLQKHYSVACNWKNYHDNTLCDYHVAIAHRTTLNRVQGPIRHYRHQFEAYVNLLYTPTPAHWQVENPVLPHLSGPSREGFFTYGIYPNLHLLGLPNGLLAWLQIQPQGVDRCEVRLEIFGIPDLSPSPAALQADFEAFMAEDMALTESVQRGYASGTYTPGPVNGLECRIVHQQRLIAEAIAPFTP